MICINSSFKDNTFLHDTPLESASLYRDYTPRKPNKRIIIKPVGENNSLRPLTLCNCCRKLLSLIKLRRIEDKVDAHGYTGPWQAAYKKKKSCGDLVWYRMLISLVKETEWSFHNFLLNLGIMFTF